MTQPFHAVTRSAILALNPHLVSSIVSAAKVASDLHTITVPREAALGLIGLIDGKIEGFKNESEAPYAGVITQNLEFALEGLSAQLKAGANGHATEHGSGADVVASLTSDGKQTGPQPAAQ